MRPVSRHFFVKILFTETSLTNVVHLRYSFFVFAAVEAFFFINVFDSAMKP